MVFGVGPPDIGSVLMDAKRKLEEEWRMRRYKECVETRVKLGWKKDEAESKCYKEWLRRPEREPEEPKDWGR